MSNKPNRNRSASVKVRQAAASGQGRSTTWVWVGALVAIVIVGAIVIGVSRGGGSASGGGPSPSGGTVVPNGNLEFGTVSVQGGPLPGYQQDAVDTAIGLPVPQVTGQTFDGATIPLAGNGQPMIIIGLAHWCQFCQQEVPDLQEWFDGNGMPSDVAVYAVATSNEPARPNFPAGDWLRREKWSVPTIVDDRNNTAGSALGVGGFPYFLVVSADGQVITRTSGIKTPAQWEALLESARTGIPLPG